MAPNISTIFELFDTLIDLFHEWRSSYREVRCPKCDYRFKRDATVYLCPEHKPTFLRKSLKQRNRLMRRYYRNPGFCPICLKPVKILKSDASEKITSYFICKQCGFEFER